jgi:hypothetical protein
MKYFIVTLFCYFLVDKGIQAQKVYVDENPSYIAKHKEQKIEKIVYTPQSTIFFCRYSIPPTKYKSIVMFYGSKSKKACLMVDSTFQDRLPLIRFRNLKKNGVLVQKELKHLTYIDPSKIDTIEMTYELHFGKILPDIKSIYLTSIDKYKTNNEYFDFFVQIKKKEDLIPLQRR